MYRRTPLAATAGNEQDAGLLCLSQVALACELSARREEIYFGRSLGDQTKPDAASGVIVGSGAGPCRSAFLATATATATATAPMPNPFPHADTTPLLSPMLSPMPMPSPPAYALPLTMAVPVAMAVPMTPSLLYYGVGVSPAPPISQRTAPAPLDLHPARPSLYNFFMKDEMARLKAANSEMSHKEAFKQAARNWSTADANPQNQKRGKFDTMWNVPPPAEGEGGGRAP